MDPELAVDGELQFDAAVLPKLHRSSARAARSLARPTPHLPRIEAGNIGYKIAQRLGGYAAYGPILQGLNAPSTTPSRAQR